MPTKSLLKHSEYHDSVTLMLMARELLNLPGVLDAGVVMGTEANKGILAEANLLTLEVQAANPNDLVIVVQAENDGSAGAALARAEELLAQKRAVAAEGRSISPGALRPPCAPSPKPTWQSSQWLGATRPERRARHCKRGCTFSSSATTYPWKTKSS